MDLPTCPSCGQSVLDENPETCPFCGASMKTGEKPPEKPGSKQATSAAEPAEKTSVPAEDEDPFAIETTAQKTAVRVALRRSPERSYRVQCPMCETVGYIPKSAAGQPVKCANPSCMVPVFEAPEIKEEEAAEEEPAKGTSPVMIGVAVMMMAVAGFSIWYFMIREPNARPDEQVATNPAAGRANFPAPQPQIDNPPDEEEPQPEPQFDFTAFRQQLLDKKMQEISRSQEWNSQRNRKPDCRQLLAETYARLGQLENAQKQVGLIDQSGSDFLLNKQLSPLVEIAWRQTDQAQVAATIAEAEQAAARAPSAGRSRFDDLSALAALLVAQGRSADAQRWIEKAVRDANITDPDRKERLRQSSSRLRVLRDLPEYPFSPLIDHPAHRWDQPEWVTVTMLLVGHGENEKALEWMKNAPQERVRGDVLLAYSRWKIRQGEMTADQAVELVKDEPVVNQIRVLAEASRQFDQKGDRESAAKLLTAASQGVESLTAGKEFQLPSAAEILNLTLPDPAPVMNQVLALSALARAQVAAGDTEQGFQTVQRALKMCRSIGPTPSALAARPRDQDDPGAAAVEQELKQKLKLTTDNQIRKSFNDYENKLESFEATAELRMRAEEALLSEAVFWGLSQRVWEEMQSRIDERDEDRKEPWLESELLPEVANALQAENSTEQLGELKRRAGDRMPQRDAQLQLMSDLDRAIEQKSFKNLTRAIEQSGIDRERLETLLVDRLRTHASQGQLALMTQMIEAVPERLVRNGTSLLLVREELYFVLGRIAARLGRAREIIPMVSEYVPSPNEEISLLAGVALGLDDAPLKTNSAIAEQSPPADSADIASDE